MDNRNWNLEWSNRIGKNQNGNCNCFITAYCRTSHGRDETKWSIKRWWLKDLNYIYGKETSKKWHAR